MVLVDYPSVQERNDREAAAEDEGPRLAEEERDLGEDRPVQRRCDAAGGGYMVAEGEDHCVAPLRNPFLWRRPDEPYEQAGDEKDPDDLGLGDDGDRCGDDIDHPEQLVSADALCRQLVGADGDDADDRRTNAIKDRLHPCQAAVRGISHAERQHHQERRQHERDPHQRRSQHACAHVAQINRQLRGQWAGRQLCQGESLDIIFTAHPSPFVDEVLLHVSGERNRAAESHRSQPQEVADELSQRRLRVHCFPRYRSH